MSILCKGAKKRCVKGRTEWKGEVEVESTGQRVNPKVSV